MPRQRDWKSNRTILQSIERIAINTEAHVIALRHEVRAGRRDEAIGDYIMARTFDEVLEKIRAAKTVSESTNVGVREIKRLLKEAQAAGNDPAKMEEAVALLDAMAADDAAVLTENTPAEEPPAEEPPFEPSGN